MNKLSVSSWPLWIDITHISKRVYKLHADVSQLISVGSKHAQFSNSLLLNLESCFLDFLSRAPTHEHLSLNVTEGVLRVKCQYFSE